MDVSAKYARLSPRLAWLLAAPHTWTASIFPVLIAVCICIAQELQVSLTSTLVLLVISVLLQSAVNTLNDYFDYVKGSDSSSDNVDPSDAILVYNNINPKHARNFAFGLVACALLLGVYCIWVAGWVPLAIAGIGVVVILLYSGGRTPISYLPIGEAVSGIVMGDLICFASYVVLSCKVDFMVLLWSIPEIICIALIMLTNNTCDIEKDIDAGRLTLPVILGRSRAVLLYKTLVIAVYVSAAVIVAIWFPGGVITLPFFALATYPLSRLLFSNAFTPKSRIAAMGQVCSFNIAAGAFYCLAIAAAPALMTL